MAHDIEAAHHGHLEIQKDQMRMKCCDEMQRLFAILRFADDGDIVEWFQAFAQHLTGDRLIIHDQRLHYVLAHP